MALHNDRVKGLRLWPSNYLLLSSLLLPLILAGGQFRLHRSCGCLSLSSVLLQPLGFFRAKAGLNIFGMLLHCSSFYRGRFQLFVLPLRAGPTTRFWNRLFLWFPVYYWWQFALVEVLSLPSIFRVAKILPNLSSIGLR